MTLRLRLISALVLPLFLLTAFTPGAEENGRPDKSGDKAWVLKAISTPLFLLGEKQSEKTFTGKPGLKNTAFNEHLTALRHGVITGLIVSGAASRNGMFPVDALAHRTLMYPHHGFW